MKTIVLYPSGLPDGEKLEDVPSGSLMMVLGSCCGEESVTILSSINVLGTAGAPKVEFWLGPTATNTSLVGEKLEEISTDSVGGMLEGRCGEESVTILSSINVLGTAGAPKVEFWLGPTATDSSVVFKTGNSRTLFSMHISFEERFKVGNICFS